MVIGDHFTNNKNTKSEQPYKSFAPAIDRLSSYLLDQFAILIPTLTLFMAYFKKQLQISILLNNDLEIFFWAIPMMVTYVLVQVLYYSYFIYKFGGSLGNIFFGVRVLNINTKEKLSFYQSVTRSFGLLLSQFLFFMPMVAIINDKYRRTFYDKISDSVVFSLHKGVMAPNMFERSISRMVYTITLFFAGTSFLGYLVYGYVYLKDTYVSEQYLCGTVSETAKLSDASLSMGRLDTAMTMYAAGSIDDTCFEKEVDYAFVIDENDPKVYLAKSFLISDNVYKSNLYLEEVCRIDAGTADCYFSKNLLDDKLSWSKLNDSLGKKSKKEYLKIWVAKKFLSDGFYYKADKVLESISPVEYLSIFYNESKIKILTETNRISDAQEFAKSTYFNLSKKNKRHLSQYLCYNGLSNDCELKNSLSCDLVGETKADIENESSLLTHVKLNECGDKEISYLSYLSTFASNEYNQFIKANHMYKEGFNRKSFNLFYSLIFNNKSSEKIVLESLNKILSYRYNRIERDVSGKLLSKVFSHWKGLPKNYLWNNVGLKLFDKFRSINQREKAILVGGLIKNKFLSHKKFVSNYKMVLKGKATLPIGPSMSAAKGIRLPAAVKPKAK